MEAKLRSYRESSLSEPMHIFGAWIPFSRLQPKKEKANSRRRDYSLAVTFWAFLWQVLTPCTPCLEVVRKVQSFCSELKLKIVAQVTSPTARRAGDWPAKISMRSVSAFWNVFWRECVKSNSGSATRSRWSMEQVLSWQIHQKIKLSGDNRADSGRDVVFLSCR